MRRIYLAGKDGKGKYSVVDEDTYQLLMETDCSWYLSDGYAIGHVHGKKVRLHRYAYGEENIPPGKDLDHVNGNRLDNRKCNLRPCTRAQNAYNRNIDTVKDTTSEYSSFFKGVSKTDSGRYRSDLSIRKDGKILSYTKVFDNELDAAVNYNKMAIKEHGDYAKINTVPVPGLIGVGEFKQSLEKRLNEGNDDEKK